MDILNQVEALFPYHHKVYSMNPIVQVVKT
jgi:hypothetical protein